MQSLDSERWTLIEKHLDRALELDAGERDAWLASLERETPDLAAQVRELLARRERTGFAGFLADGLAEPQVEPSPGTLAGRRIGAYVLESELGSGGMGSVWRARRADGQYERKRVAG